MRPENQIHIEALPPRSAGTRGWGWAEGVFKEAPENLYFGLNENVPHRFRYLNIWCSVGGTVQGGIPFLEKVRY